MTKNEHRQALEKLFLRVVERVTLGKHTTSHATTELATAAAAYMTEHERAPAVTTEATTTAADAAMGDIPQSLRDALERSGTGDASYADTVEWLAGVITKARASLVQDIERELKVLDGKKELREANAALIAVATLLPEMAEALRRVLRRTYDSEAADLLARYDAEVGT